MEITPRQYQQEAVSKAVPALLKYMRALVVLATGLGKTITAALIAKKMKARRILFLVHNNFILENSMKEFRKVFGDKPHYALFNGRVKKGVEEADFVFASFQTIGKHLKKWHKNHFDLMIVDESHHSHAETYRPVIEYFHCPKIGITATPDRSDLLDIREFFGDEVINITLEEAIARGWLPRIEYHVVTDESLDDKALEKIAAEIREGKRRFTIAEVNRRIFIRKRDQEIAKIINGYNEKAIVFCTSVNHADRLAKYLNLAEPFHSRNGKSQTDIWDRNQKALADLRNGTIRRICSVNAFNEGVDVPSVGLVAFCRVTGIPMIFFQQLGRGLRPGKDKLIVLDFVGNLERIQLVLEMMNKVSDLHEKYTSKEERNREGYERQNFEVSGKGFEFTFSNKIVDLMKILEHCERELYSTWQEAGEAAQRLGISTCEDYVARYKEDPRLPCTPKSKYRDFPGYPIFLGRQSRNFYQNWRIAAQAARRLSIRSSPEYQRRYKEDPHLPANPLGFYPEVKKWNQFLGKKHRDFYPTWKQAARAAKKLRISLPRIYKVRYKEDPRLPSDPPIFYQDFPGWPSFFGRQVEDRYPTWQQAGKAACKLGISSRTEYYKLYKSDSHLPGDPIKAYSDFPGWIQFLNKEMKDLYPSVDVAAKAARKLGIRTQMEYKDHYKEDPRLPSTPASKYPDFPGWPKFLGKEK